MNGNVTVALAPLTHEELQLAGGDQADTYWEGVGWSALGVGLAAVPGLEGLGVGLFIYGLGVAFK